MPTHIDSLILDLGNVLAFHDNEKLFKDLAWLFGSTAEAFRARLDGGLWRRVNTGLLPGDALRQELCERLHATVSRADFEHAWCGHFTLYPQMIEQVEALVGKVRLVLLSNTHDLHFAYLRAQLPVLNRFDELVVSYEVGAMKPERAIYERALTAARAPAGRCAYFDDAPAFVDGAVPLGIRAKLFTTAEVFARDFAALQQGQAGDATSSPANG